MMSSPLPSNEACGRYCGLFELFELFELLIIDDYTCIKKQDSIIHFIHTILMLMLFLIC